MSNKPERFSAIHGMRGIAAVGVLFFHLSANVQPAIADLLPQLVITLFSYGYLGVPIFFVISGFVISYSTGSAHVDAQYVGNFLLRRSIRLDITYWASIALALMLLALKNEFLNTGEGMPSAIDVVFHMFYLQDLMRVDAVISVVYWTLCLEVQFYLFYMASLWFSQQYVPSKNRSFNLWLILCMGLYSLAMDFGITANIVGGLFIPYWHYFLMGILASHVVRGLPKASYIFIVWLLIEIVFLVAFKFKEYTAAGICCSGLIGLMWKLGALDRWFKGRILTYLGTLSYTLYLVHPDIGWTTISFGKYVLGEAIDPWQSGLLLLIGIAISVLTAHIFHLVFERPTQYMASRLKSTSIWVVLRDTFNLKSSAGS